MYSFCTLSVIPRIPREISRLDEIAYNFWFSWHRPAQELFYRINDPLWEEVYHNPVKFLLRVQPKELEMAATDQAYLELYQRVISDFDKYLNASSWYNDRYPGHAGQVIAYFSAEFGLHESHPIYSGGLGLLAGDHCKSASDLGLPLVGVGLLYKQGYFTQRINREGWQEAEYPHQNFYEMPMRPAIARDGSDVMVRVDMPGRQVCCRVWQVVVGRINIYLLDTDISSNSREDRCITAQLYGGSRDIRIAQEMVLGIGGVRALRELGITPYMWHINEGHAAFMCLERLREKIKNGIDRDIAREAIKANTLFTTHTPVPAGHDVFSSEMMDHFFGGSFGEFNMSRDQFMALGWDEQRHAFNMTVLALNMSGYCNGVSKLHGQVSRKMFRRLFGEVSVDEVPIAHVTNGVHIGTWMAQNYKILLEQYLGSGWMAGIMDKSMWQRVEAIPDEVFWRHHMELKAELINFCRERLKQQRIRNYESADRVTEVENYLNPEALTIGFARRFATYKRAALIFSDIDRLARLVNDSRRPVQFVFAGKAHPADHPGQEVIKRVYEYSNQEVFRGKVVFIENYDIDVARHLLLGVDIWLNNPRRPEEASGTSGMKAAANGVVNFSVLDGWWPEAYNGSNGFVVGEEKNYINEEMQDREDSHSLYRVLEDLIIPLYYKKEAGISADWVNYMKSSMKTVTPVYNTRRMVTEYTEKFYVPGITRGINFRQGDFKVAARLDSFKDFLRENWSQVAVTAVETSGDGKLNAGDSLAVYATVKLGTIWHDDVCVEIAYGRIDCDTLVDLKTHEMKLENKVSEGTYRYFGSMQLPQGALGFTVRVRPTSPDFAVDFEVPLVTWASVLN